MSSATPSEEDLPHISQVDIPAEGTPEHRTYYYKKVEESIQRIVDLHVIEFIQCPGYPIGKIWLSLGETQQKTVVSNFMSVDYAPDRLIIMDEMELDDFVALLFASEVFATVKEPRRRRREPKGSLLKLAIRHSSMAKQVSQ
ncbi:hypothetical protein CVT25_001918 [Psilocybe cyanescens]|uniref:Uncharacterized protein n=1 Tax=Psilocybe cyanescens TaxID=93625 RepID=A0A409WQM6_PSICY|nr:hypothetical protein CVT25_001918 [Psilocybe cyanescens]